MGLRFLLLLGQISLVCGWWYRPGYTTHTQTYWGWGLYRPYYPPPRPRPRPPPVFIPKVPQKPICNCVAFAACMAAKKAIEIGCMAACALTLADAVKDPKIGIPILLACLIAEEGQEELLRVCVDTMSKTKRCSGAGLTANETEALQANATLYTDELISNFSIDAYMEEQNLTRHKRLANCPGGSCGCNTMCETFNCHACHRQNANLGCNSYDYSTMFGDIKEPCKPDVKSADKFWKTMEKFWKCVKTCTDAADPFLPADFGKVCCGDKSNWGNLYDKYEYSCARTLNCQMTYRSGCGVPYSWEQCKKTVGIGLTWPVRCACYTAATVTGLNCGSTTWPCEAVVDWLNRGNWMWL